MTDSQGFRDLKAYQMAFDLAMESFEESKKVSTRREIFTHRSNPPLIAKRRRKHWRGLSKETISENVC
jgi:hypothetical protein